VIKVTLVEVTDSEFEIKYQASSSPKWFR